MKEQKEVLLQVKLPEDIVQWIDLYAEKKGLKRGPTSRMILIDALSFFHTARLKQLRFIFSREVDVKTMVVAFKVTSEINERLLDLCRYCPLSKKKLAEILICQEVEKRRGV